MSALTSVATAMPVMKAMRVPKTKAKAKAKAKAQDYWNSDHFSLWVEDRFGEWVLEPIPKTMLAGEFVSAWLAFNIGAGQPSDFYMYCVSGGGDPIDDGACLFETLAPLSHVAVTEL